MYLFTPGGLHSQSFSVSSLRAVMPPPRCFNLFPRQSSMSFPNSIRITPPSHPRIAKVWINNFPCDHNCLHLWQVCASYVSSSLLFLRTYRCKSRRETEKPEVRARGGCLPESLREKRGRDGGGSIGFPAFGAVHFISDFIRRGRRRRAELTPSRFYRLQCGPTFNWIQLRRGRGSSGCCQRSVIKCCEVFQSIWIVT